MKIQILSLVGLLASVAVAAPSFDGCDELTFSPDRCPKCPFKPKFSGLLRSGHHHDHHHDGKCHRECPEEFRHCFRFEDSHHHTSEHKTFELSHKESISCPGDFSFDLRATFESCHSKHSDHSSSKNCLKVFFHDSGRRDGDAITESNLGVYLHQEDHEDPRKFNFNGFCHGSHCSVPTENLPGFPHLCDKEIFLAVGNNRCRFDDGEHRKSTKVVKVRVSCSEEHRHKHERCDEFCCCPGF